MKTTRGTAGIDNLKGTKGADHMLGLGGDDVINGGAGNDKLEGGDGEDFIYGANGVDRIFGEDDNDFLFGEGGKDFIDGGDGNDIIVGASGSDTLIGGAGDDRMFSNTGNDKMDGGADDDYYEVGRGKVTTRDRSGDEEYTITADCTVTIDDSKGMDKLRFKDVDSSRTITINDLMFKRLGDDLIVFVDGYQGKTTVTFFFAEEDYRIERLFDEDTDANQGYSLEDPDILNLSNGDSPVRGSDIWDL